MKATLAALLQVKTMSFLVHLMRNAVNIAQMHKGSWKVRLHTVVLYMQLSVGVLTPVDPAIAMCIKHITEPTQCWGKTSAHYRADRHGLDGQPGQAGAGDGQHPQGAVDRHAPQLPTRDPLVRNSILPQDPHRILFLFISAPQP